MITEGSPEENCPFWTDLNSSARVECLLGLDALATAASQIASRHPANLVRGFPRPFNLNPCLSGVSIASLASALLMGISLGAATRELRASESEAREQASGLTARVGQLEGNRTEMVSLRREAPDAPAFVAADKASALRALADGIPDNLTLIRFAITRQDHFELEAILVGRDYDPEGIRQSLARSGFEAGVGGDWAYDPQARRLSVRGIFGERAR